MFLFFPLSLFVQRLSTICTHCFNFFFAIISFAWTGVSETDLRDVRGAGHQESAVSTGRCSRRLYCQRPRAGPEIFKDSWKFRVWRAFAKITNVQIFVWSYIYIFLHQACFQNWRWSYLIIFDFPQNVCFFLAFSTPAAICVLLIYSMLFPIPFPHLGWPIGNSTGLSFQAP